MYCGHIPESVLLTENCYPEGRAEAALQTTRLERIQQAVGRRPRKLLDFGCGTGALVAFTQACGVDAVGVDLHTLVKLSDLAAERFDAVTMVEVIEHLSHPVPTFERLLALLTRRGVIYCESSFVDSFPDVRAAPYINPEIGHRCVFSRQAVSIIAERLNRGVFWINDNVFVIGRPVPRFRRAIGAAVDRMARFRNSLR